MCDSAPWNQGRRHGQDEESDRVTKRVTIGTCRLCVARFSSRHVILTTLVGANGSPSPEAAVFPPEWFLARRQPTAARFSATAASVSDCSREACKPQGQVGSLSPRLS